MIYLECYHFNSITDTSAMHQVLIAFITCPCKHDMFFITKEVSTATSTCVYETLDQILSLLPAACRDYMAGLGSPTGLIVMAHQMCPCLCTFYQVLIFFFPKAMWGFKRPAPSKAGTLQSCVYIHANMWTHLFSNHLSVQLLPRWLNCMQKIYSSTWWGDNSNDEGIHAHSDVIRLF